MIRSIETETETCTSDGGGRKIFLLLVHREPAVYYICMGPKARKALYWIAGAIVVGVMAIAALMGWGIWEALHID